MEVTVNGPLTEDENLEDWDWTPAGEVHAPEIDDRSLREEAVQIQGLIGTFRPPEHGVLVAGFADPLEDFDFGEKLVISSQGHTTPQAENVLVERIARLGEVALDLLRYFSDNPGDRSAHAEQILGYPLSDINKLLSGSLSQYLKRNGSGGWECHPWVLDQLSALDKSL